MNVTQKTGEILNRFMLPRLFGIVAVVDRPKADEHFPMCSGIIMQLHDYLVLVTVAHYIKSLEKWQKEHRLIDTQLIIHNQAGAYMVKLEMKHSFYSGEIDLGFVLLPRNVVKEIVRYGGKPVEASAACIDDLPDNFLLIGHAATHTPIATEVIAQDNTGQEWLRRWLSGLAITFSELQYDGEDDTHNFRFTPLAGIDDYCGTSGGPIFGFKHGSVIKDYSLFAIQSKQVREGTRDQKVKYLIGTSGVFVVEAINSFLNTLVPT